MMGKHGRKETARERRVKLTRFVQLMRRLALKQKRAAAMRRTLRAAAKSPPLYSAEGFYTRLRVDVLGPPRSP